MIQREVGGRVVITEEDTVGNVLGSVVVRPNKKDQGLWLQQLFVAEDKRGYGIGARLVDQAIDYLGGTLSLEVGAGNKEAIKLYSRKGFVVVGEVEDQRGRKYLQMRRG